MWFHHELKNNGYSAALPEHPDTLNLLGRNSIDGLMSYDMTLFVNGDVPSITPELTDDYLDHTVKYARAFVGRWMETLELFRNCYSKKLPYRSLVSIRYQRQCGKRHCLINSFVEKLH